MSKGHWRRPTRISEEEFTKNWDRIFGKESKDEQRMHKPELSQPEGCREVARPTEAKKGLHAQGEEG